MNFKYAKIFSRVAISFFVASAFLLGAFGIVQQAKAQQTPQSFMLILLYRQGALSLPDDDGGISPYTEAYAPPPANVKPQYVAELYDPQNKLLKSGKIDPKQNLGKAGPLYGTQEGWVGIIAPYDKNAARIIIRDNSGNGIVLDQPVDNTTTIIDHPFLPEPGIGANSNSQAPAANNNVAKQVQNTNSGNSFFQSNILLIVLVIFLIAIAAAIAWFFIRGRSE